MKKPDSEQEPTEARKEPDVKAQPWWEQRFGAFADSPEYEEATRLGREYRESLRPRDEPA